MDSSVKRCVGLIVIVLLGIILILGSLAYKLICLEEEVGGLRIQVSTLHKIITNKKKE